MFRLALTRTVTAALVLLPMACVAGGPPWLCLPVDGVTAENSPACAERLKAKLEDKQPDYQDFRGFQLKPAGGQWYLMFHFDKDVALSDIDAALKGSPFS